MKFIVQFRLKPDIKKQAVAAFERRGPNRNPGVTFAGGWIGKDSDVAFVLVDGVDEAHVARAAQSWAEFGQPQIHSVVDLQEY